MTDPLSKLPLFATDDELAVAIVGRKRASDWKRGALRVLEARGFPRVDPLHGGRPVPLVRKWFDLYLGVHRSYVQTTQEDAQENLDIWVRKKRHRRDDRKPQLGLDYRCQKALLYMVAHPDCHTQFEIPDAGAKTMATLVEKGVIAHAGKDSSGDDSWTVTELGAQEAKRINFWHHGETDG
jgi:hypothetical protein